MKQAWVCLFFSVGILGCNGVKQEQLVSDCGGFPVLSPGTIAQSVSAVQAAGSYCAAEVLAWQYDAGTKRLMVTDSRVLLNCCGEHSITIDSPREDRYVIDEVDQPEGSLLGGARCGCMCVYDFHLAADEIGERPIHVKLRRDVTDDGAGVNVIWAGDWDLGQGEGSFVLDETDLGPWCEES